nr:HD domain-containing protein [candidate division Zixibacteria bacterium]
MAIHLLNSKTGTRYLPIYLESLRIDTVLSFDLYIKIGEEMILYRSADLPFSEKTLDKLLENNVNRLYVSEKFKDKYQKYIEQNLDKILNDRKIPEKKKANILYDTSKSLMKDVLENPTFGENIRRSTSMVTHTVGFILKGQAAFHNLLRISSFDYYTYTHSVNVCTFAVALAQQLGIRDDKSLNELGMGALLHDIGKSKISDRILNKRTTLSPMEFELMKKHPKWGIEILSGTDMINPVSYYPVLQHHERGGKDGYPNGIGLSEMHDYSKIVAIVDSFDAMTTERVYQKAKETFPALQQMFSMKNAYERKMLKAFAELMGPSGLLNI